MGVEGKQFDEALVERLAALLTAALYRPPRNDEGHDYQGVIISPGSAQCAIKSVLAALSETYALVPLKTCRAAKEALHGVIGLIDESRGVVGWHLNGNEALWSEFNYPTELVEVVEQLNKCLPEEEVSPRA